MYDQIVYKATCNHAVQHTQCIEHQSYNKYFKKSITNQNVCYEIYVPTCCNIIQILVFIHLQNMHEDFCGGKRHPGLCPEMDPYDGELLLSYLLDVRFRGN